MYGLLDDKYIIQSTNLPPIIFDNNKNNYEFFRTSVFQVTFKNPVDIKGGYLKNSGVASNRRINIFSNSVYVKSLIGAQDGYFELDLKASNYIQLSQDNGALLKLNEFDLFGNYERNVDPVTDLKANVDTTSADLAWINPVADDFINLLIYKDGEIIAELDKSVRSYEITKLKPETEYEYQVVARYYDDFLAEKVTVKFKTLDVQKVGEVIDLTASVDYERVDLTWKNPTVDNFKNVNIYRNRIDKKGFLDFLKVNAATKIDQTNGTYFNDLTVIEGDTYEYTVTTQSVEGLESDGVKKIVTIPIKPKPPKPEIEGEETDVDADGNYTFSWTSPTKGKVKVIVGGKEYAITNAANLKITIPAKDMKFTIFGDPDVKLIAIDEDGNEGNPIQPPSPPGGGGIGNVDLPFTVPELIRTTFGFIALLGGIILLAIAVYLTPFLIKVIKLAVKKESTGRRTRQ